MVIYITQQKIANLVLWCTKYTHNSKQGGKKMFMKWGCSWNIQTCYWRVVGQLMWFSNKMKHRAEKLKHYWFMAFEFWQLHGLVVTSNQSFAFLHTLFVLLVQAKVIVNATNHLPCQCQ